MRRAGGSRLHRSMIHQSISSDGLVDWLVADNELLPRANRTFIVALVSHNGIPLDVRVLNSASSRCSQNRSASRCLFACNATVGVPLTSIVNSEWEKRGFIVSQRQSIRQKIVVAARHTLDVN